MISVLERLRKTSIDYKSLINDFRSIFEKLTQVEAETELQRKSNEYSIALDRQSIQQVHGLLEKLQNINKSNSQILGQVKSEIEILVPKIFDKEPLEPAGKDAEKLNATFKNVLEDWTNFERDVTTRLKRRSDEFRSEQVKCIEESTRVS